MTGLARSLRMSTPAEGVETKHQLAQVRDLGCTEMQGNLFSPAIPIRDVARFSAAATAAATSPDLLVWRRFARATSPPVLQFFTSGAPFRAAARALVTGPKRGLKKGPGAH